MADCEVTYAYHVTDVLVEDAFPPNWRHLKTAKAPDEEFDGPLYILGTSGVFLTTTLRNYGLPTRTIYPTDGQRGDSYWRVCVPLTRFNNKRIFKVQEHNNNATRQVLLLLADNNYSDLIDDILEFSDVEELTHNGDNEFLYRDEVTKDSWFSNNLDRGDPYWVNVFVPHRVRLGSDCDWDVVQHY